MTVGAQLRKAAVTAILDGATKYSIAKGAGVNYATFLRWLEEHRDIRLSTVNSLAAFLNLELRPADKPEGKDADKPEGKDKLKAPAVPAVDWTTATPKKKRKDEGRERRK